MLTNQEKRELLNKFLKFWIREINKLNSLILQCPNKDIDIQKMKSNIFKYINNIMYDLNRLN